METSTIVTMIIVVGTVWGGLAVVLRTALKKEKQKQGGAQ
ncbi:MAG: MetS family NSS transporter small subunit [Ignavibacteriae bacterium]|nr:MetS family NSS transporter small subunit [Ignavibacteriota bacterium]